jgi:hypothetical protein
MRSGDIRHSEQQIRGNVMRSGVPRVKSCTRVCFHVEAGKKCLFPVHVYSLAASATFKQKQTKANDIVTYARVMTVKFCARHSCFDTLNAVAPADEPSPAFPPSVGGTSHWQRDIGSGTTDQTERCPVFDSSLTV